MIEALDEIAGLVHRYADAVTRHDTAEWARCWAEDARWTLSADRTASGRDEIVALFERALSTLEGVVQNVLNGAVSVDGQTGAGRWYLVEHYRRVTGEPGLLLGCYDDKYVEREGHWLFADRVLVPSYQGPPDLSGRFAVPEPDGR